MARHHQHSVLVALVLLGVACQLAWSLSVCREDPGCPATGRADLALPCEGNCRSYASCNNGKWQRKTCFWPWTRFSPTKKKCVLMAEVNCDWWKDEAAADSSEEDSGDCTKPACPKTGKALVPNACPGKCQYYYSCEDGKATAERCKPWENFDPISLKCDYWDVVDCTWSDPTTVAPPTTESTLAPTSPEPTPEPTPEPPCEFTPTCPASGQSILADPCRCQAYYQCDDGAATEELCKPWENFDPNTNECIWWSDVDCTWPKHTTASDAPTTVTEAPTEPTEAPTEAPTEPTDAPTEPTDAPTEPTDAPTEPTDAPTEPTDAPTEPTEAPTEPTDAPTEPTDAPTEPTDAPTEPTDAPTEPTDAPTEPTDAPTEPTEAPTEPTEAPTEPTDAPTEPTEAPTEPTEAPTEPTDAPTEPTDAPTEPTEAPTEPTDAPTEPTDAPTEPTEAPTEPTDAPTEPTEAPTEPPTTPELPPTVVPDCDFRPVCRPEGVYKVAIPCPGISKMKYGECSNGVFEIKKCGNFHCFDNTKLECYFSMKCLF